MISTTAWPTLEALVQGFRGRHPRADRLVFFLDEIQGVEGWERWLRRSSIQVTWEGPKARHERALKSFYERFPEADEAVYVTPDNFRDLERL